MPGCVRTADDVANERVRGSSPRVGLEPIVTVVVPAWNLEAELEECLASVRAQGPGVRALVIDNASNRPLALGDADVARIEQRVSVGAARNHGLALVRTPFVAFMDGDDVLLPGAIGRLVELLLASGDAVAADGAIVIWESRDDRRAASYYPPRWTRRLRGHPRVFAAATLLVSALPTAGPMVMRTDAARAARGFGDSNFLETWPLAAALAAAGRVVRTERPCKLYRVSTGRETLKLRGQPILRSRLAGRRDVRRRIRRLPDCAWWLRLLAFSVAPLVHGVTAIMEPSRPRFSASSRSSPDRAPAAAEEPEEAALDEQARGASRDRDHNRPR